MGTQEEEAGGRRREVAGIKIDWEGGKALIYVGDIMITNIHTIHPEERVALAKLRMLRQGIGALPVVDENKTLIGIITLRDIDMSGSEALTLPVKDLMTRELIIRKKDALLGEIIDIMMETGIQRIPIVDEGGKLIGLVTQSAVIRSIRSLVK